MIDYIFNSQSENLKEIRVSRGFLQGLFKFKGQSIPIFFGLPDDATLVHIAIDQHAPGIRLLFKHPTFPEIVPGCSPPYLTLYAVGVEPCEHTKEEIRQIIEEHKDYDGS